MLCDACLLGASQWRWFAETQVCLCSVAFVVSVCVCVCVCVSVLGASLGRVRVGLDVVASVRSRLHRFLFRCWAASVAIRCCACFVQLCALWR